MPLPIVLVVLGIGLTALDLLIIACLLLLTYYALVNWIKTHPITIPTFPSYSRTWDDYPVTIPPIAAPPGTFPYPEPVPAVPITKPESIPIDVPITTTKPRTRNRDKGIWNVYDLHFRIAAEGRFYNRGKGYEPSPRKYNAGDIYKYGITSFKKVYLRYFFIQMLFPTDKGDYILEQLNSKILEPYQWYLENVKHKVANDKEVELIEQYLALHLEFPPGNTFRG